MPQKGQIQQHEWEFLPNSVTFGIRSYCCPHCFFMLTLCFGKATYHKANISQSEEPACITRNTGNEAEQNGTTN